MGFLSFFVQDLAIDLGTANAIIIQDDQVVLDEPSVVAIDVKTGKMIAVGHEANLMLGRTHEGIKVVRPLRDGVIADFNAAEMMLRGMIKNIHGRKSWFNFNTSMRMVVCIPSGSTEVEVRAVRDSSEHAGAHEVYMIHEPMAAALGLGLNVEAPEGLMVVDIGGGTTEVAVISLGGIVTFQSIRIAGDVFTADIQSYMRHQYNIRVGERGAEEVKIQVGSALTELENPPQDFVVRGPNLMTSLPIEIPVSYKEIAHSIDRSIAKLESGILGVLEKTPPELYADIQKRGIYLTGGGALLRGLDKRFSEKINIPFYVVEDPLHSVARGTGMVLKNINRFKFLIK